MILKTFSKYFQNALIEFVQTLPQPRQLRDVQAPFSDFWKKKPPCTEKYRQVKSVMSSVCCHGDADLCKTWIITNISSLYSAAAVTFSQYHCYCWRGKRSKWGGILPKKSSRATLKRALIGDSAPQKIIYCINWVNLSEKRWAAARFSSVGRALDWIAGSRGFDSQDQTNTQGLKIYNWEMKVVPLPCKRSNLRVAGMTT